jgi:hypothetical protein
VVLESNERKRETGVVTEPELERNVEGSLREGIARSTHLVRRDSVTRTIDRGKVRVREEGKLGGLAHHLVVTTLLIGIHRELNPKLHPVTILLVDALTTNLNLHGVNELVSREIQPPSIDASIRGRRQLLINLGKSHLEIRAVSKVSVSRNGTGHATAKITLTIESLLNRLHGKVGVATVSHLPIGNLRVTGKVNILSAISYQLHQTTSHIIE